MEKEKIRILIACEESQAITKAFRERGFVCYSCDLYTCSGGHPEWHINGDALPLITCGSHEFYTQDGVLHNEPMWDLVIAHPPCTYLTCTGNRWFDVSVYGEKAIKRWHDRKEAIDFFMKFTEIKCRWAIENPVGCMSTVYRTPDMYIQPYYFGDPNRKKTCLWVNGLPTLRKTNVVKPNIVPCGYGTMDKDYYDSFSLPPVERSKVRSKTFKGIADAIAQQWGDYLIKEC